MRESKPVRVMIVDDHDQVRNGLKLFLEVFDDLELAGEAKDGQEAVRLCAEVQPDVILMDLVMAGMDGITATRLICQKHPKVRIVALTSYTDQALIQKALQVGVVDYVRKDTPINRLAEIIRAANKRKAKGQSP